LVDETPPPFQTRRERREAERNNRLDASSRLHQGTLEDSHKRRSSVLTDDTNADDTHADDTDAPAPDSFPTDSAAAGSATVEIPPPADSAPAKTMAPPAASPVQAASAPSVSLPGLPATPEPRIVSRPVSQTIPLPQVVEHDTSLDLTDEPPPGPADQLTPGVRRRRPDPLTPPTTHTFPVTIAPQAAKARPTEKKTAAQRLLTWTVMVAAPLLFIGVSMPVNLFYTPDSVAPAIATEDGDDDLGPAFIVDASQTDVTSIARESWSVTSYAEVLRSRYGGRSYNYSVGQGGEVRWPFPVAVPISSGFGNRVAPCRYCSSYHRGVDFVPGNGVATYAIAAGTVTQSEFSGGYGQHVYIEHQINGQSVLTVYAHLQRDSSPLRVGDQVDVGAFVGLVGSTGTSTGAHLHFEVRIDGVYVDPFAYLQANAR
jgi:murein DD-endopeptidase MepM/ murein hydrolase activator NlpD